MPVPIANLPHRDYRHLVPLARLDAAVAPDPAMLRLYRERCKDPCLVVFKMRAASGWWIGRLYRIPAEDGGSLDRPGVSEICWVGEFNEWHVRRVQELSERFVGFGRVFDNTFVKPVTDAADAAARASNDAVAQAFDEEWPRIERTMDAAKGVDNRPAEDRMAALRRADVALARADGDPTVADIAALGVRPGVRRVARRATGAVKHA